jgi:hypothetical protein
VRSSTQALPLPRRRDRGGRAGRANLPGRRPVQLELFRSQPVARPAGPRPVPVPRPWEPEAELCRRLNRLTGGRLRSVTFTDNRRTILSVRPGRPGDFSQLALRIHRSFQEAPEAVVAAVAAFVESRKGSERARQALAAIREHFARHRGEVARRRAALRPVGLVLDLRKVADELNQRFFAGRLAFDITWGKGPGEVADRCRRRTRTASLQLGSYSYEDNLIRVHAALDQPGVPRYVVEAVVYHELLHADMPPVVRQGRRYFHTPEFRRRERLYRQLDRANDWVQEHLHELLQARRGRKAEPPRRGPRRA